MQEGKLLDFVWWEITGKCQLSCDHCYASSGPDGTHGTMTVSDWQRVITQSSEAGATLGQFIGGEPTLHPALPRLVRYALDSGMQVEIYTNLVHVTPELWDLFRLPGVRLATSYYSDQPEEHEAITKRPSFKVTTKNITRAHELGIPIRAGVIGILEEQRSQQAIGLLEQVGIADIGYDDLREVGRGVRENGPGVDQLCGNCGDRQIAISPTGEVWPCVFSRWLPMGNVRETSFADILVSRRFAEITGQLRETFEVRAKCAPDECNPKCGPSCGPACQPQYRTPCNPRKGCSPSYGSCNPDKRLCDPDRSCKPNQCRPKK
ncbi:radical SAM/SPASM domain-containing protein [Nonomuraea purpurea]|uniref:Radical SAM/SPASM domain-containing protein n=1 Tax=Nonomuraea purpurea TaxID=1849276 RepID=A0ABV8GR77_9ACTN